MSNDPNHRCLTATVALAAENVCLRDRLRQMGLDKSVLESELEALRRSAAVAEEELSHFTNLFVASQRLHETLETREVLQAIEEIMINLVGSEEIAIFGHDGQSGELSLLSCFGVARERFHRMPLDRGPIARSVRTGETFVAEEQTVVEELTLTACVPLRVRERVIGAIAVFRLLPQKVGIEALDRALFELLATDGAHALYWATALGGEGAGR